MGQKYQGWVDDWWDDGTVLKWLFEVLVGEVLRLFVEV